MESRMKKFKNRQNISYPPPVLWLPGAPSQAAVGGHQRLLERADIYPLDDKSKRDSSLVPDYLPLLVAEQTVWERW